jgi:histone-lysine N-methyltransferase SETMAR
MHILSPNNPKKFKRTLSSSNLTATAFWDRKGVLMVEFIQQGNTIKSVCNVCKTLKKMHTAIQNRRCRILIYSILLVLLHDNALLHTAACTQALLVHFNRELFDHPPYSPDLAPSCYNLFTYMKNWLGSQCCNNNELMECVKMWLSSQAADFFDTDMDKLIPYTRASILAVTALKVT